ncbi:MAG: hypothetical protein AAF645_17725 [Myxococcota bacterium]
MIGRSVCLLICPTRARAALLWSASLLLAVGGCDSGSSTDPGADAETMDGASGQDASLDGGDGS